MKRAIAASSLLLLGLLAGCARHTETVAPSASPAITNKADCDAAGGEWHSLTRSCDDIRR